MYTKFDFGWELKKKVHYRVDRSEIGAWSSNKYFSCNTDEELNNIMYHLSMLEVGEEFLLSYEILDKIANDLMEGKNINLDSDDYRDTGGTLNNNQ